MALIQYVELRGVSCDKPFCANKLTALEDPQIPLMNYSWDAAFQPWLARNGWSLWVGRSHHMYCPDHGPSRDHTMRQVV